jgi:hypothetical protein
MSHADRTFIGIGIREMTMCERNKGLDKLFRSTLEESNVVDQSTDSALCLYRCKVFHFLALIY